MADPIDRRHGLEARLAGLAPATGDPGLEIDVVASLGHANLRGNPNDERFMGAVRTALGRSLPLEANTVSNGTVNYSNCRVCWLGPDEWLLTTTRDSLVRLLADLERALDGIHAAVNDLSDGHTLLRLSGARVEEILAAGCTLDLARTAFPAGCCAQTGLAKAAVVLIAPDDSGAWDVVVRRSFADYLVAWLAAMAGQGGVAVSIG